MPHAPETLPNGDVVPLSPSLDPGRYHALDRVRALAMLLGVVYHTLIFRMFAGGGPPPMMMGPGAPFDASKWLGDWLHSFRMPLFFLIAGFFARMMLGKYGTRAFLAKRYARIGLPLLIGMFTFGPLYVLTRDLTSGMPRFGPGMMPPPGAFPPGMPGPGMGPPPGAFPPGMPPFGPPGGGGFPGMGGPGYADRLFGPFTRFVQLNHLWFLWYLLIFVTVAPFLAKGLALASPRASLLDGERLGTRLIRRGLAPALLAVASTPALLMTSSPFGWFLGLAPAIFRAFPDFLLHLDPDMAFYFAYFLVGWWLHRERAAVPALGRAWLPNLVVGLGSFWLAMSLERQYGGFGTSPRPELRIVAYFAYCLGSASTGFATLGFFLRFLNSPSKTWRYLADTALWVYLVHQPLVLLGLAAVRPLQLPWWALTLVVSSGSVAAALLLYEAIVRRTPLVRLFGPSDARRRGAAKEVVEVPGGVVS